MKIPQDAENPYTKFFIQNLGMLTGFAIMALITVFEEDIGASFK